MVEPPPDDLSDALGDSDAPLADGLRVFETAVGDEQANDLVDEERVAFRLLVHRLHERVRRRRARRHLDEPPHVVLRQSAEEDTMAEVLSVQIAQRLSQRVLPAQLDIAVGAEHHQPAAAQLLRQELQQQQRRLVRPVHVVEDHHHWLVLRGVLQESRDAVEKPEARLVRLQRRRCGQTGQSFLDFRHHLRDVGGTRPHLRHQLLWLFVVRVGANNLHPGPVSRRALALVATAPEHLDVAQAGVCRELLRGARLANARLADEHHQTAST